MVGDPDLKALTRAVKSLDDQTKDLVKILKAINDNFLIYAQAITKYLKEERDAS